MAFEKLKKKLGFEGDEKAYTLTDPEALAFFGAIPTTSGLSVGPGNAMRVPAVACADGSCARPMNRTMMRAILWIATAIVAIAVLFPYLTPYFLSY